MAEISETSLDAANIIKDAGNKFLADKKYSQAAEKYTEAIEICPTAVFYSNRAMAMIKLESYGVAISDANEAIKLDPKYVKSYYRRGSANFALGKYKEARKDFRAVIKLKPKDQDAQKKLSACEKFIKEDLFLKAIESEQTMPISQQIHPDDIAVEDSYTGPRLGEDGSVSVEFCLQMLETFKEQKPLHRKYMLQILIAAKELFCQLPSLIRVPLPSIADEDSESSEEERRRRGQVIVCGDTHGQFYDLCNIFEIGGMPSSSNPYLFNGDFVDRGSFSLEVVVTLIAFKLAIPDGLHMTRGNHETKGMNKIYGFEGEVKHKYDNVVMQLFSEVFQWIPLCAVVNDAVFVVHGGLSTINDGCVTLKEIAELRRDREPPESGLMSDLLWSDPQPLPGRSPSKRGVGFSFGPDITENFLRTNSLQRVVRSHEVKDEGYVVEHNGKCITIFSAPNYCDQMGNKGAFIRFGEDMEPNFVQYTAVPHPNVPPMHYASAMSQFGL